MNSILFLSLAEFMIFVSVSCELPGTVDSVNVTCFKRIYPIGFQQCEAQCLSYRDCQLMVFHARSLSCYMRLGTFTGESIGTHSNAVVKQRKDILNGASDFNTTADISCVTLSGGELGCASSSPCGPPPEVVNATIKLDTSVIDYSCKWGYKKYFGTPEPVVCKADGQWTTPKFDCTGLSEAVFQDTTNASRAQALEYCRSRGAHFLRINSFEQGEMLITKYQLSGTYHVDGMYVCGTWIFSNGDAVNLTMFAGEVNNATHDNCIIWEQNHFISLGCALPSPYKTVCETG